MRWDGFLTSERLLIAVVCDEFEKDEFRSPPYAPLFFEFLFLVPLRVCAFAGLAFRC